MLFAIEELAPARAAGESTDADKLSAALARVASQESGRSLLAELRPTRNRRMAMEHYVDRVEAGAVESSWRAVCACGWASECQGRVRLWTSFNEHLGLEEEDTEGRLGVMYAVATALADSEAWLPGAFCDEHMIPRVNDPVGRPAW
jgi:hypothetical protein